MHKTNKQLQQQRFVSGGGQFKGINAGLVGAATLPTQPNASSSAITINSTNKFINNGELKYIATTQTTNGNNMPQRLTFAQVAGSANVPTLMQGNKDVNTGGIMVPTTLVLNAAPGVGNAAMAAATPTVAVVPVIVANSHSNSSTGATIMPAATTGGSFLINNDVTAATAGQPQFSVLPSNDGATAKYVITAKNGVALKEDIINQIILGKPTSPRALQATVIKRTAETTAPAQQKVNNQKQQKVVAAKFTPTTTATPSVLMNSMPIVNSQPAAPIVPASKPSAITTAISKVTATNDIVSATAPLPSTTMSQIALQQPTNDLLNATNRAATVITVLPTSISNVISNVAEPASLLKVNANCMPINRNLHATGAAPQHTIANGAHSVENSTFPNANANAGELKKLDFQTTNLVPPAVSTPAASSPRKRAHSLQSGLPTSVNVEAIKITPSERRHSAAAVTPTKPMTSNNSAVSPQSPVFVKQTVEEEELVLCTPTKYRQKPPKKATEVVGTEKTENMNVYEEEEYLDSSPEKSVVSIIEELGEEEQTETDTADDNVGVEEEQDDEEEEVILPDMVYTSTSKKIDTTTDIKQEIKKEFNSELQEQDNKAAANDDDNDLIIIEPPTEVPVKQEVSGTAAATVKSDDATITLEAEERLQCNEELQISSSTNNSLQDSSAEAILPNQYTPPRISNEDNSILPNDNKSLPNLRMRKNPQVFPILRTKTTFSKVMKQPQPPNTPDANSYSAVLEMISNYNMLKWKERVGIPRGTKMQFQLNEYNLLQIYERCPTRVNIHTAYEKAIYERESSNKDQEEQIDPLLYLCRRCNCHGPATDFLAPEFCSLDCLKRDTRKRKRNSPQARNHKTLLLLQQQNQHGVPAKELHQQDAGNKRKFRWSTYMTTKFGAIPAPINLFLNPFPISPNPFTEGMKLEAIDPENCSLFCVCTVVKVQGYRLKLHFDGYDKCYDFWVNADSMDIFPPGWCSRTGRVLQPPRYLDAAYFNWSRYVKSNNLLAMRQLFTHLNSAETATVNPFKIGMHLEAEDLNDTGKLCVATVADVINDRIRIHFDGWDDCYDYWVHISSPYIHPCGWHEGRQQLIVPPDYENLAFDWPEYIRSIGKGCAATEELFCVREPINFEPNMKLEVVDPRNPSLIRPASIVARRGHRIKVHLECWPSEYCFWMEDDSPDLHPIGWCDDTGHELESPPGYYQRHPRMPCDIPGCRGIGNAKSHTTSTHAMADSCPYAPGNWRNKLIKPQRVSVDHIVRPPAQSAPFAVLRKEHKNLMATPASITDMLQQSSDQYEQICCDVEPTIGMYIKQEEVEVKEEHVEQMVDSDGQIHDAAKPLECAAPKAQPAASALTAKSLSALTNSLEIQVAKEFLSDYGPRLQQNYELLQHNFKFNLAEIKTNPLNWSTKKTAGFVERLLDSKVIARKFLLEDIDGSSLLMLQQSDLTDALDLKLGPAIKLYTCILQLRTYTMLSFDIKPPLLVAKMMGKQ